MYLNSERETIEGHLFTNYTDTVIDWDNRKFEEDKHSEYIHPIIQSGRTEIISLAGATVSYRRLGLFITQIFVPMDSGTIRPRQIADALTALFVNQKIGDMLFLNYEFITVGAIEDKFQCNLIQGYQWDRCI